MDDKALDNAVKEGWITKKQREKIVSRAYLRHSIHQLNIVIPINPVCFLRRSLLVRFCLINVILLIFVALLLVDLDDILRPFSVNPLKYNNGSIQVVLAGVWFVFFKTL